MIQNEYKNELVKDITGKNVIYPYLKEYSKRVEKGEVVPRWLELHSCQDGCVVGSGVNKNRLKYSDFEAFMTNLKTNIKYPKKLNTKKLNTKFHMIKIIKHLNYIFILLINFRNLFKFISFFL